MLTQIKRSQKDVFENRRGEEAMQGHRGHERTRSLLIQIKFRGGAATV
jgi:hypothetical protein